MDIKDKRKYIFGNIFLLANRLQVLGDQYLKEDGMTTKQWFLNVMTAQHGNNSPTLSEIAELMGSSRQNIKQLALKLAEKGFLTLEKDERDARALRLILTDKSRSFWEKRQKQDNEYLEELFGDMKPEEIDTMYKSIGKLFKNIERMEKKMNA